MARQAMAGGLAEVVEGSRLGKSHNLAAGSLDGGQNLEARQAAGGPLGGGGRPKSVRHAIVPGKGHLVAGADGQRVPTEAAACRDAGDTGGNGPGDLNGRGFGDDIVQLGDEQHADESKSETFGAHDGRVMFAEDLVKYGANGVAAPLQFEILHVFICEAYL